VRALRRVPERVCSKRMAAAFERIPTCVQRSWLSEAVWNLAGMHLRAHDKSMTTQEIQGIPYSALALVLDVDRPVDASSCERSGDAISNRSMSLAAFLFLCAVKLYQATVPDRFKRRCIYTPTCSRYAIEAVRLYGLISGIKLTFSRLGRCNGALFKPGKDLP